MGCACACGGGGGGKVLVAAALVGGAIGIGAGYFGKPDKTATGAAAPATGAQVERAGEPGGKESSVNSDPLSFTMNRIDGTAQALSDYRGKVVLIVNTASECGLTPQYKALEALYQKHKDAGLVILGFPANNFGGQEPGSNSDIATFCTKEYGVTFPMFEKISVKGDDAHDLYKALIALPEPLGGEPKWNFTKFVLNRKGEVVARFEPRTAPDDEALVKKLEELLAEKAG